MSDARKQDTRRKIMLGGLVIKSGLSVEPEAVILGALALVAKALSSPKAPEVRERFRLAGDALFQETKADDVAAKQE
jgi:hypothetical protein